MRTVLKRPILSEKSAAQEPLGKYVFEVDPKANKVEIRNAVEERYNVSVKSVRTSVSKPRVKERWTGRGFIAGKTDRTKKAIVTLSAGETIDLLGELEDTSQE
jgi:large subunit ribosomal protein L23